MVTISVVMPTYNTPVSFLKEAVESILRQTFRDFEFIIVDDGTTDESRQYLEGLTDRRIRIIRNETNIGITKSLNIGFREARGKYIARMDGDDVSLPKRFEKQLACMKSHPNAIACGTKTAKIGRRTFALRRGMEDMERYRVRMLFANPGPVHSTAFFDREKLNQYHIQYDEQLIYAQDYGMWMTISRYGDICVLPEVLGLYRVHAGQISKAHRQSQIMCDKMTQRKLLTQLLGDVTDEESDMHYRYSTGYYRDATLTPQIVGWYDRILAANSQRKIYDQKKLKRRIIRIKRKLINQTFTKEMSIREKAALLFRNLPFPDAVYAVLRNTALRILRTARKNAG